MDLRELFVRSNEELARVVSQITDEHWDRPLPEGLSSEPTTLARAVNDHTYDDAWVPDVLAGRTKDEVGERYEPLLTTDRSEAISIHLQHNGRASDAVRACDDLEQTAHLSYGDFPVHEYLRHIISFRAFRAHDIATMIGVEADMPDDIVEGLFAEFVPHVEEYRKMGVFPEALDVADDADRQTKLLALVGRE